MLFHLLIILFIILRVAFITYIERKILGLSQSRVGVNKTILIGLFQPLLDAIKLVAKELSFPEKRFSTLFYVSPFFMLVLTLLFWQTLPIYNQYRPNITVLLILILLSLKIIPVLLCG